MQVYRDKKFVEVISILITAAKEIQWIEEDQEKRLQSKLYNKVMEYANTLDKENTDLITK